MTAEEIKYVISQGESLTLEFKKSQNNVSDSVYETICSFLNHSGGNLLMGVKDTGEILGVNKNSANDLIKNIINTINNPERFSPRTSLYPEIIDIDGKSVIYIYVQPGHSVFQYKGRFYDRNGDADNDVTQDSGLLANLFTRKSSYSSESVIIPMLKVEDLDEETFDKCRKLVSATRPTHSWLTLTNIEILRSVKLIRKDASGHEGICLAGLLLFGTTDSIATFCSTYRTEAIYRNKTYAYHQLNDIKDTIRYDDRITERGNLIQLYYKLTEFVERHLPDKFYIEEGNPQRQDLRSIIFREIIANLEVHREYSNPSPGIFEIFSDRIVVSNWNKLAIGGKSGIVSIDELYTYPKNPLLVRVFRELGLVEELGSGFRNIKKYAPVYYRDSKIEIRNDEKFVFSMTYQNITNNVNESETTSDVLFENVNECEKLDAAVYNDVNESESTCRLTISNLIGEHIPGIAPKIANRMIDEIMTIYEKKQLTKLELKEQLGLSEEQIKIDLRELTKSRLLDQKGRNKHYILSDKIQKKISELKCR